MIQYYIGRQRLKRRRKITKVIRDAEKKGLYEIAEHATSEIDLSLIHI